MYHINRICQSIFYLILVTPLHLFYQYFINIANWYIIKGILSIFFSQESIVSYCICFQCHISLFFHTYCVPTIILVYLADHCPYLKNGFHSKNALFRKICIQMLIVYLLWLFFQLDAIEQSPYNYFCCNHPDVILHNSQVIIPCTDKFVGYGSRQ